MGPSLHRLRSVAAALFVVLLVTPAAPLHGATPAGESLNAATAGPAQKTAPAGPVAAIRLLVRTGERAPDGGTFTVLADPALNDRGDVAFGAETSAREAAQALYLRRDGRLTTLVAVGRRVPTGGTFYTLSDVVLNDRGTVLFMGRTTDRVARLGIYAVRNGAVVPIVVTGRPAPSGGVFTDFANPTINDSEVVAFVGRTSGTGQEGIFTNVDGVTTTKVMGGWPAPGGGLFQFFLDGTPALNIRGQSAVIAATVAVGGMPTE